MTSGGVGYMFQSTPPRGRRPWVIAGLLSWALFQSTPPRGRRHRPPDRGALRPSFNPRLHAGGDLTLTPCDADEVGVSIHASTREATEPPGEYCNNCEVSIHASTREATTLTPCDADEVGVSIHASTREAT